MKILIALIFSASLLAQNSAFADKLANTYSIVAKDPKTGNYGVAVQSNWFAVGQLVTWAEAGVGAIATQSFVNVSFGPNGLKLLREGKSAQETLDILIKNDDGRDVRQVAIVDKNGNVAAHTGKNCIEAAGDMQGKNFSVQANMMKSAMVWPAMQKAYQSAKGDFADRLIQALEAAQAVGGDIRGKQSAAILIVKDAPQENSWENVVLNIRIDDHAEPLKELRRIYNVHLAYNYMNEGDLHMEHKDTKKALAAYNKAMQMFPDNLEMQYWTAVGLANSGDMTAALPMFQLIFNHNENWRILTERIAKNGMLEISKKDIQKILDLD
jgi:uncharacterized Ntn-hydrolase superfamily protein